MTNKIKASMLQDGDEVCVSISVRVCVCVCVCASVCVLDACY